LKIGKPDTDHDHPEECVVGAVDALTEKDDVCSLDGIDLEIIDVDTSIVIVFKVLKVGGTRNVSFRRWPFVRRIHKPPIPIHKPNKFRLLKARQTFHQKLMRVLAAKNTINVIRCLRGANFFLTFNLGQNEIYRLYGIRSLLSEHRSNVARIFERICDRIRAQPPNGQTDGERRRTGKADSDDKQSAKI
jgi:hypothetical protein